MNWISALIGIALIILVIVTALTSPGETWVYIKANVKSIGIIFKWGFDNAMVLVHQAQSVVSTNYTQANK
jgi:plastocyanin domain-containing protein